MCSLSLYIVSAVFVYLTACHYFQFRVCTLPRSVAGGRFSQLEGGADQSPSVVTVLEDTDHQWDFGYTTHYHMRMDDDLNFYNLFS